MGGINTEGNIVWNQSQTAVIQNLSDVNKKCWGQCYDLKDLLAEKLGEKDAMFCSKYC
jgi:hypothetical protein